MNVIKPIDPNATLPVLLPVKGVTKHFGLSPSTIYRWISDARLETIHVGRSRYVKTESVAKEIERLRA